MGPGPRLDDPLGFLPTQHIQRFSKSLKKKGLFRKKQDKSKLSYD